MTYEEVKSIVESGIFFTMNMVFVKLIGSETSYSGNVSRNANTAFFERSKIKSIVESGIDNIVCKQFIVLPNQIAACIESVVYGNYDYGYVCIGIVKDKTIIISLIFCCIIINSIRL